LIREKLRKGKPAKEKEDSFFDNRSKYNISLTFEEMNLSRSLNKAISSMNYINPTPIQSVCIPVALLGKDICACAATGTGKTCAYMIPILERLLFKPVGGRITRVLVMVPTRELAMQVYETGTALAKYTSISIALSTGGMDLKSQEAALRLNPDVVIATPGRLIDHLHNSPSFNLNGVEILVLDEADRMLDEYFEEQMLEIMRLCSPTRQAMLFSATMTDKVKDLASVSLKKPVKLFVNENTEMALNLRQQFVRIRKERECSREAILAALLKRSFTSKVLLFARTKEVCHRLRLLLGLLGIRVAELHGNLSQAQRIDALEQFKKGVVDVLVATDVAARGIDVPGVKTVINYQMPHVFKLYVHRVGRTARAGRSGCAVSLGVVSLHNTPLQSPAQRLQMVDHLTLAAILEQQIRKLSSLIADVFGEQQHRLSQLFQLQLQAVQLTVHRLAGNFHRPHLVDRVHQQLQADHETTAIFQPGQIQTVVCTTTAAQSTIRDHASGTTKQRSRRCRRGVHLHFVLERLQVSGHPRPPSTARTVSHN
ncbi:putative ATP-dependent RNA helicase DDX27, partial [Trichinella pseudospiralis]